MLRRSSFWPLLCAATVFMGSARVARADYAVRVDVQDRRGVWEGWGCSFAWWARAVGGKNYGRLYADLFFTTQKVPFLDQQLPGLGLNIIRYNVGGGGRGATAEEKVPSILPWHRAIDGYWISGADPNPDSPSWDWSRDAGQRSMMQAALLRGVNRVEFFSNAPMWWMMDSRSSAGGRLQSQHRRDFAVYLASVVEHAQRIWGVRVDDAEPFNEPSAGWWNYPKNQEGANFARVEQEEILGLLREELDRRGLQNVALSASDENSMNAARQTWEEFKTHKTSVHGQSVRVADLVAKVNVHSYEGLSPMRDNGARQQLRQSVGATKLWASEYGDNDASGLSLAQTITQDINFLRPTAWIYWQPLEPGSPWGPVNGSFGERETAEAGAPTAVYTKFFVLAQFTRTLRPGALVLGSSDANTIAAYDAKRRQLCFITTNSDQAQNIEYELSNLAQVDLTVSITATNTDGSKRFQTSQGTLNGTRFQLQASPGTVYSLVFTGVQL